MSGAEVAAAAESLIQFGNTKVFMKSELVGVLEKARKRHEQYVAEQAVKIQSAFRMFRYVGVVMMLFLMLLLLLMMLMMILILLLYLVSVSGSGSTYYGQT